MSAAEQLLIERHEHVVTLTLNRPGAKNAFGLEMLARLADAWEMVDADDDVRAVVLTGAGGDFCAGADLKLMHGDQSDMHDPVRKLETFRSHAGHSAR